MMNRAQATLLPDMRHTWAVSQLCGQRSSHPQHEATPCLGTTALHKEAGELDTSWQPRGAHVPTGWAQGVGIRAESECPGPRPPLSLTTCDNSGVSGPGAGRLESRLSPMAGCQGTQAAMDSADRPLSPAPALHCSGTCQEPMCHLYQPLWDSGAARAGMPAPAQSSGPYAFAGRGAQPRACRGACLLSLLDLLPFPSPGKQAALEISPRERQPAAGCSRLFPERPVGELGFAPTQPMCQLLGFHRAKRRQTAGPAGAVLQNTWLTALKYECKGV